MATDPIASAQDALVAHLATELGSSATVRRGWPEAGVAMDIGTKPEVAVTASSPSFTLTPPGEVDATDAGDGTLTVTYRVAMVECLVQVDLWCAHRATKDALAVLIEAALHNQLPHTTGLWLTQSDYHSRPLTLDVQERRDEQDVAAGEWRASWTLRLTTDLVVQTDLPELTQLDIDMITELIEELTETTSVTP